MGLPWGRPGPHAWASRANLSPSPLPREPTAPGLEPNLLEGRWDAGTALFRDRPGSQWVVRGMFCEKREESGRNMEGARASRAPRTP
jgi:hypothetical protein